MDNLAKALTLAIFSKDLLIKVLGPTADYLGDSIKSFTKKRVQNTKRIFKRAAKIYVLARHAPLHH